MIDYTKITVVGGKGGNGTGSFRRVKGKRRGKADGGDGGGCGNVYLEATLDLNTLEPYRFVKNYKAGDGQNGDSNLKSGATGRDLVLKVPFGTVIGGENAGPFTTFLPASAPLTSFEINSSKNGEKFTSSGNEKRAVGGPSTAATRLIREFFLD